MHTSVTSSSDPLYGVMIEDCFVYGWQLDSGNLVVDLDFSLWPGNKFYESPKTDEWTCYKRGQLIARNIEILEGLRGMSEVMATTDPDGTKDYGSLDSAVISGNKIEIRGPFGGVRAETQNVAYELR
jgi:hypothetical protein